VAKTITLSGSDDLPALNFTVANGPSHGSLDNTTGPMTCDAGTPATCTADVLYTPVAGQWLDSFTFTVTNPTDGTSTPATVSITVDATPVAVDDPDSSCSSGTTGSPKRYIAIEDQALIVNSSVDCGLLLNDTDADPDPLTAAKASDPAHGSVTVTATGGFTYSPNANYFGLDSFTYTVSDGLRSGVGTVSLTVFGVDDKPSAGNDTGLVVPENAPATALNVLANDTYLPDGPETLTIVSFIAPSHGTVVITGGGTGLTYRPAALYIGADSFKYTIKDSGSATATAQAQVALTVVKDVTPPVVSPPSEAMRTGVALGLTYVSGFLTWTGSDSGVGLARFDLQRSTNGGGYAAVTLSTAKATSFYSSFSFGTTYRFRVRGVDANGNASAWAYSPSFGVGLYQENSSAVVYSGAWSTFSNPSNSGGATRYASVAGQAATFTRSGRDFAFVAPKGTIRGSARIYVDNVLVSTVSEWSTSTSYRQVLWSRHFSAFATHTIKVVVLGTGRIDVDAFLALR
jgi:VCBS repeat-containing protein